MPALPESYASPGLRVGLLLDDHPGAVITYREGTAAECGVPASWGGDQQVVICRIERPNLPPVDAYKPVELRVMRNGKMVDATLDPDWWNVQSTKALGRALKRCGYPDDMRDLKALVLWRQRNAEVAATLGGSSVPALPPGVDPETGELEAAGRADPDDVGADDVTEAEVVPAFDPESATPGEMDAEISRRLKAMGAADRRAYLNWRAATFPDGLDEREDYDMAFAVLYELTGAG